MKKLFIMAFIFVFTFSGIQINFDNITLAQSNNSVSADIRPKIPMTQKEIKWLQGLGFPDHIVNSMSQKEYNHIKKDFAGVTGKFVKEKVEYFKIYRVKENDKWIVKNKKVTKEEALRNVEEEKRQREEHQKQHNKVVSFGSDAAYAYHSDTEYDSWIKNTTSYTYLSNGQYKAQHSFKWLEYPDLAYMDTIAITHGNNVDKIANSEFMRYLTEGGSYGTDYDYYYTADEKTANGYAFKFDLKAAGTSATHEGYMYYKFYQDNSSDSTADLYGHYAHAHSSSWYGIDIGVGFLSLSGTTEANSTDTHVDVSY